MAKNRSTSSSKNVVFVSASVSAPKAEQVATDVAVLEPEVVETEAIIIAAEQIVVEPAVEQPVGSNGHKPVQHREPVSFEDALGLYEKAVERVEFMRKLKLSEETIQDLECDLSEVYFELHSERTSYHAARSMAIQVLRDSEKPLKAVFAHRVEILQIAARNAGITLNDESEWYVKTLGVNCGMNPGAFSVKATVITWRFLQAENINGRLSLIEGFVARQIANESLHDERIARLEAVSNRKPVVRSTDSMRVEEQRSSYTRYSEKSPDAEMRRERFATKQKLGKK